MRLYDTYSEPQFSLFFLLVSLGVSLAIIVPLTGALTRFRANYNPKGLQLDAEGGAQPYTGPVVSTFFGMLKRVHRIEVRVPSIALSIYRRETCNIRDGQDCTKDSVRIIYILLINFLLT